MRRQWIAVAVVIALMSAVALVSTIQAQAQTSLPPPADADSLRTPWGEPDLQGIWGTEVLAPLERPVEIGDREFLTDEEIAALESERSQDLGRDERATPGTETDVAGAYNNVWQWNAYKATSRRTSLIVDPPNGRLPPLTEGAIKRAAAPESYNTGRMNRADGPEDRSLTERCFGSTLPNLGERDYFQIVQSPGYVTVYYEHGQGGGGSRIIPVDNSAHLPSHLRLWLGDARGRWDGDTLVVDTTNFTAKTNSRGSRENLHLVERFRRVDAGTLDFEVTVEDPTTWTRPWTVRNTFVRNDDRENRIFESTCHEGNVGLTGVLANIRAADKAFAEGRGRDPATMRLGSRRGRR